MFGTGFLLCSKLPAWQYVSPNRPACSDYRDVVPAQRDDLAELF